MLEQQMADLPPDRIEAAPLFTNVGFDVLVPWAVQTKRTRGGKKRRGQPTQSVGG